MVGATLVLLVALGLDNAATASGLASRGGAWRWTAVGVGLLAVLLCAAGALFGRVVETWLHGWAQLMAAVLLFALALDAVGPVMPGRARPGPPDAPAQGRTTLAAALAWHLDELGVGFAFGSLPGGRLPWWAAICLAETACALLIGFWLQARIDDGRRLGGWSAAALFVACAVLLFSLPATGT